jgi:hypothetical protein
MNDEWIAASRRMSPRLVTELLEFIGEPLFAYFDSLDLMRLGEPVSWAGPQPASGWLDIAREYMERWVHQQHIRDATGRPGHAEPALVRPVIAASMHALPVAMRRAATSGDLVVVVPGVAGGTWSVVRRDAIWELLEGVATDARTTVEIPADTWWRVVTLGITREEARRSARVQGDEELALAGLGAVAIIA